MVFSQYLGPFLLYKKRQQVLENTEEDKEVAEVLKQNSSAAAAGAAVTTISSWMTPTLQKTSMTPFYGRKGFWHFWLYTDKKNTFLSYYMHINQNHKTMSYSSLLPRFFY